MYIYIYMYTYIYIYTYVYVCFVWEEPRSFTLMAHVQSLLSAGVTNKLGPPHKIRSRYDVTRSSYPDLYGVLVLITRS